MADVISFADWTVLQELINNGNTAVSGMTAAEAEAALNASANSGLYVYNTVTGAGANNVINFPNAANAAEAAAEYLAEGGTTAASGAATAATGASSVTADLAITQATGGSGVMGLLSVPLPTAAAALAPLAGVALGTGLYSLNPELWEKISRTLLPFCYDDSELMPAGVDENGQTYYGKEAIDALKELFESEHIGVTGYRSQLETQAFTQPIYTSAVLEITDMGGERTLKEIYNSNTVVWEDPNTAGRIIVLGVSNSDAPFVIGTRINTYTQYEAPITMTPSGSFTHNGNTVYYGSFAELGMQGYTKFLPNTGYGVSANYGEIAWTILYGIMTDPYPTGTGTWTGDSYPSTVTPKNVLAGYDENDDPIYTPYYPVRTPTGDPGTSADPDTDPSPVVNPDPRRSVDPYISPVPDPTKYPDTIRIPDPAPIPNPVPDPQPVPDPNRDPSRDPDPDDIPDDPDAPTGGKDTGDSTPPAIPLVPLTPASGASLLHVYNPTQSQIDAFGSWLWTTWSDASIWQTIQKLFNDPMDGIIGLHELYATPALNGSGTIRCGYMDSGVASALVGTRYTTINCGTIVVEEYYQNYLDYSPYTQVYVYLPFIGIMPLSADDIIGNAVNIKYHVDSYTGCCIALITVARSGYSSTVYQFEGNCAVEIPITSGYQSALMSGLLAVAGTAISGNPSVGLTAAHVGRAGLGKNAVQHPGSFGSSYGAMGVKIPYIIVRRPVQKKVNNYSLSYGYPAHKMVFVGNCKGYLRVREVRVMSTTATNIEKDMIVTALKEGVYVK